MRNLFDIDVKNYDPDGSVLVRPSARGIIIKDGKVVSSIDGERGGIIGFTKEHKLVLGYMTIDQAADEIMKVFNK